MEGASRLISPTLVLQEVRLVCYFEHFNRDSYVAVLFAGGGGGAGAGGYASAGGGGYQGEFHLWLKLNLPQLVCQGGGGGYSGGGGGQTYGQGYGGGYSQGIFWPLTA